MQDEPTPEELTKAVADFLRNDIAPVITGHNAFKLRVAINALDLVTRQLTLQERSDAAEAARLSQLLGRQGALKELNRALADRMARPICRRRGWRSIFGRPRWTSSPSISRITGRTSGSWGRSRLTPAHQRHCERSEAIHSFLLLMHGLLRRKCSSQRR